MTRIFLCLQEKYVNENAHLISVNIISVVGNLKKSKIMGVIIVDYLS